MDRVTQQMMFGAAARTPVGQQEFITPGTFQFTVPPGVFSISAVTVEGGGAGGGGSTDGIDRRGGDGGKLRWISSAPVTPEEILTVTVGAGAAPSFNSPGGGSGFPSSISRGAAVILSSSSTIGGLIGGGNGGGGGSSTAGAGGGGAGGYAGAGGSGANSAGVGADGNGGGGGGGAGSPDGNLAGGGYGGSVGLRGQGASGVGGDKGGGYGLNGNPGSFAFGISVVGGGAPAGDLSTSGGNGQPGGVRIIWGQDRAYPSTRTGDEF